jgi:hypothetical protein
MFHCCNNSIERVLKLYSKQRDFFKKKVKSLVGLYFLQMSDYKEFLDIAVFQENKPVKKRKQKFFERILSRNFVYR